MKVPVRLVGLALSLAIVGAACAAQAASTPGAGPSPFLAGFRLPTVLAAVNATPNGPRCTNAPGSLSSSTTPRDSTRLGMTIAGLSITCTDPGDGHGLAQAWSSGISAELARLGAAISMTGTGGGYANEWEYTSGGLRGNLSFEVLPAAAGQYWLVMRVFEPF